MSPSAALAASADAAAGALLRVLSGSERYADAAPAVWAYVHVTPPPHAPPPILDALARLAAAGGKDTAEPAEAADVNDAANALVSLSSVSPRAWAQAACSSVFARIPAVRNCIAETLLPPGPTAAAADLQTPATAASTITATQERLSALSAEPAATALYTTWRARTPLDVAVATITTAPTAPDACERLSEALRRLPIPCWRYVCDDDFARVVAVLRSRAACEASADALGCEAFAARVRSGFGRATPAAGFLYGALMGTAGEGEDGGGRADPGVEDLVSGWPSLFGEEPSFRLGYLSWCAEYGRGSASARQDISEATAVAAFVRPGIMSPRELRNVASEAGWFASDACGIEAQIQLPDDPEKRKLVAAAYAVAPTHFEKPLRSVEHLLQREMLDLPPAVQSAIDADVDALLAALLTEIPGLGDSLRTMGSDPVDCSFSTTGHTRVASSAGRIESCSLRLQRLALSRPTLLMRKVPVMCSTVLAAFGQETPSCAQSVGVALAIIRALTALDKPLLDHFSGAVYECTVESTLVALGESRAANGVRGTFATLAIAAGGLLESSLTFPSDSRSERILAFRENAALRSLLSTAEETMRTDESLKPVLERLLAAAK